MIRKTTQPASLFPRGISALRALAVTLLLSFAGCAKIADPLPPEILIPMAAVDLTAQQRADHVVLRVSAPKWNTNGTAVTTLQRVDVYRLAESTQGENGKRQIPESRFRIDDMIISIPVERLNEYRNRDFLVIEDRLSGLGRSALYTRAFRYAVLFVNNKNQAAGFSNQAVVSPVAIPLPPQRISATVNQTALDIAWEAPSENSDGSMPARISGYNIYRSEDPGEIPATPVNTGPLQKPEFKDVHFDFDRTYYYRVSVLGHAGESWIESDLSDALAVTPRDSFQPLPVDNFTVIAESEAILLVWNPSPSSDVAGYRISRSDAGAAQWKPLQENLIRENRFRDKSILPGREYEYSIVAVDAYGNESKAVTVGGKAQ